MIHDVIYSLLIPLKRRIQQRPKNVFKKNVENSR